MKWDLAIGAAAIAFAVLMVASVAFAVDTAPDTLVQTEIVALNAGSLSR